MAVSEMIRLARPHQWIKNVVVILPILFARRIGDRQAWVSILVAALAFSFASAFAYILNDIKDIKADREHPRKKNRPLASGSVSVTAAMIEALCFLALAALVAYKVSNIVLFMIAVYVVLQVSYSTYLKHTVLIDVICIAMGFVLRAVTGAVAVKAAISPWLFICMFTICLFMGFCKRFSEVVIIGDLTQAKNHRPTLISYTPELLTHLITLSAAIAVISFLLYGLNDRTVENFGTNYFIYTLPVVVYGVFRFAMLSMEGAYADPTDLILRDRALQATVVLWIALAVIVIKYGKDIEVWIQNL
ncbi:MAG: decaprenyl-phosphate phosphoribosyltransferase [Planctomycetes bacterium]|nr:decaprenyl-phosphate phosphoribosyltransferase [Planctomycetota bacterium]